MPDPSVGPAGAQAVPADAGALHRRRPQAIPYGTPVWLDTTEPLSATPLCRLVMAGHWQHLGAVRADHFWGWGANAEAQAGRMKQPLRMWVPASMNPVREGIPFGLSLSKPARGGAWPFDGSGRTEICHHLVAPPAGLAW